jgi:RHS repeat-associated protein
LNAVREASNDPTGTPLAMTDALANKVWEGDLPFGEKYAVGGAIDNNRQFIGKEKDIETGLDYFGARYMDVGVGRFLAPDPVQVVDVASGEVNSTILGDPQRLNVYGYGLNNPYRYVDPDGLSADDDLDQDGKPDIGPEVDPDGDGHPGFNPIIGGVGENTVIFPPPVPRFASKSLSWSAHGGKHVASSKISWKTIISGTMSGPAKYKPGTQIEALERQVWSEGRSVTNGKSWKVMEFKREIGASGGKPSR